MKPFPFVVALLLVTFAPAETHGELRAGAAKVDVTPLDAAGDSKWRLH